MELLRDASVRMAGDGRRKRMDPGRKNQRFALQA
jgi:hypothetical protein